MKSIRKLIFFYFWSFLFVSFITDHGVALTEPVAYYSFDKFSDMGYDSSGNNLHGSDSGAQYISNGVVNGAAYFSGSGQRITIPDNALFNNTNFTVTFFLKTPDSGSPSQMNRILGKYSTTKPGGWFSHLSKDCGIYLAAGSGANNTLKTLNTPNTGRTNWTHVAHIFSSNYCATYINGTLVSLTNWNNNVFLDSNIDLVLGGFGIANFQGWLDEVKIWHGKLNESQIRSEAYKLKISSHIESYKLSIKLKWVEEFKDSLIFTMTCVVPEDFLLNSNAVYNIEIGNYFISSSQMDPTYTKLNKKGTSLVYRARKNTVPAQTLSLKRSNNKLKLKVKIKESSIASFLASCGIYNENIKSEILSISFHTMFDKFYTPVMPAEVKYKSKLNKKASVKSIKI
jgi:hypothetical protein